MPVFFTGPDESGNEGQVAALFRPGVNPMGMVQMDGWRAFGGFKSIITEITLSEQVNLQFLNTLGEHIYVYVFGDQIGQFGIGGICFADNCGLPTTPSGPNVPRGSPDSRRAGIAHVINYYREYRTSARPHALLVTILPDLVLRRFLIGMRGNVIDPGRKMFQFHLSMALVPESKA